MDKPVPKTVKCGHCGWFHFERSRLDVLDESRNFYEYINSQPPAVQAEFGYGPLSRKKTYDIAEAVERSEKCFRCGASYKDFVDDDNTCPRGVTMQGIINRDE
jgi:hypothetical protein